MLSAVLAIVGMLAVSWACWRDRRLGDVAMEPGDAAEVANTSVVIPARDEEAVIATLLDSLARCLPAPAEIVVVDDSSSDATARIAQEHGARVVAASTPPPRWTGKSWACATGAEATTGRLLLFLDADTWIAPDALTHLVAAHRQSGGLVSVQPAHHPERPAEELSAVFNLAAVAGSGAFAAHHCGPSSVAFGPCLLTSRDDYARAGGHAVAPGSVIEDIALASAYGRAGLPVTCLLGGDRIAFRMYAAGFRALIRGWTKNIAAGARSAPRLTGAAVAVWIAALVAASLDVLIGVAHAIGGNATPLLPALAVYALLAVHFHWLLQRVGRFRGVTAALLAAPVAVFVVVFVRSAVANATGRPVQWRGRSLRADAVQRPRGAR